MSFPRYESYKDSGVEWLGEVPEHWTVWKIAHAFKNIGSGTTPKTDNPAFYEDGQIAWVNTGDLNDGELFDCDKRITEEAFTTHSSLKLYPHGSLVIAMYGATIGKLALLRFAATVNQACCVFSGQSVIRTTFLFYWFLGVRQNIVNMATGGGQPNISQDILRNLHVPCPEQEEQQTIAAFLDREITKIDALITEQQRLIELLKEKRQAVISHAVTKGLNPDAPMKDSGIEWLGEVPAHWEIGRVKTYFQTCSGGTPNTSQQELYYSTEEEGIPWVRTTDLKNDVLRCVEVFITEKALADTACSILPTETVMVAMYGGDGTVGKNGLLAIPAAINQAVCGLLPAKTHLPSYVFRYIQFYRPYWMIGAESSRKDPNISQERVGNAPFLKPPLEEQTEIVTFIDDETEKLDTLTAEAKRGIELLQERRTALISAAVTGKIDVRGLVSTALPEEAAA